jgi:hypothetical protein
MSSELHELIERELAAADNRIEKGAGGGTPRLAALQVEGAKRATKPHAEKGVKEKLQALQEKAQLLAADALELGKHWLARAKVSYGGACSLYSSCSPSPRRLWLARCDLGSGRPANPP